MVGVDCKSRVISRKMESDEREIVRLWRIYKTIHEMVQDRVSAHLLI